MARNGPIEKSKGGFTVTNGKPETMVDVRHPIFWSGNRETM